MVPPQFGHLNFTPLSCGGIGLPHDEHMGTVILEAKGSPRSLVSLKDINLSMKPGRKTVQK